MAGAGALPVPANVSGGCLCPLLELLVAPEPATPEPVPPVPVPPEPVTPLPRQCSFGWSGEAVDLIEGRLKDAGFKFAFDPIRCKFKPTEQTLHVRRGWGRGGGLGRWGGVGGGWVGGRDAAAATWVGCWRGSHWLLSRFLLVLAEAPCHLDLRFWALMSCHGSLANTAGALCPSQKPSSQEPHLLATTHPPAPPNTLSAASPQDGNLCGRFFEPLRKRRSPLMRTCVGGS